MAKMAMRMCRVTWPGDRVASKTTYLESATYICLFTI